MSQSLIIQGQLIRRTSSMMVRAIEAESRGHLYCRTAWCSSSTGLANVMIGASVISAVIYSHHNGDLHVALCTLAYHFFTAEAILSMSYVNSWSTPMRWRHRKLTHMGLQICAMICAAVGTATVALSRGLSTTAHGLTGIITLALTVLTALVGPFVLNGKKYSILLHTSLGLPCYFMSSVCVVFGLVKPEFKEWATIPIVNILLGFVTFYSILIATVTLMKCMKKV